jgi:uncharacterized membrane protein YfcA
LITLDTVSLIILCITALASGFLDAVVGGGGLLQLPVMLILFPQASHVNLVASTKTASMFGSLAAAWQYMKTVKINWRQILVIGICAALASVGGTLVLKQIPSTYFKLLLWFIIVALMLYSLYKKELGANMDAQKSLNTTTLVLVAFGIGIGFYNGAIGPGTGLLLVLGLVKFLHLDFLHASAYGKILNAIADFGGVVSFLIQGVIVPQLVLPLLICFLIGNTVGSKMAIARGNSFIRNAFFVVMALLLCRLAWDVVKAM